VPKESSVGVSGAAPTQKVLFLARHWRLLVPSATLGWFALRDAEKLRPVSFVGRRYPDEVAEQTRCSEPGDGALVDNRGSVAPGH
jgi:hypothetical protein